MKAFCGLQFGFHYPRPFIYYAMRELFNFTDDSEITGIEVGVLDGFNAMELIKNNPYLSKLYLIDIDLKRPKRIFSHMKYPEIVLIEKKSDNAWKDIKEKVDFVYIDGDHSYEQTYKDIINYYQLVKVGGLVGGHDFNYWANKKGHGVIQAVTEFCIKHKKKLWVESPDWWFIK